jgi:hypothetical protein
LETKVRISKIEVVTVFELDEAILFSCGPALKDAQKAVGGRLLSINTPEDAQPSLPRAVMRMKDAVFNVALDRFQFVTVPPSHTSASVSESIDFAKHRVLGLLDILSGVMPIYQWTGVIIELEYPKTERSKSAIEAISPTAARLLNIPNVTEGLVSFNVTYGRQDNGFYINYFLGGYERRKIEIRNPKPGFISLDQNEFAMEECGIGVTLDINNRVATERVGPKSDLEKIFVVQASRIESLSDDLNLVDILP